MGNTANLQLPYPELDDPADVPADVRALAEAVDAALGSSAVAMPGEVRLWPGASVPALSKYGRWVWADGAAYSSATFPEASANIAPAWKTHAGKPDPGAGMFRVPDLRGSVATGLDAMPGGARANRITRAAAAVLAAIAGEEFHVLSLAETAPHVHGVNDPQHYHNRPAAVGTGGVWSLLNASDGGPVPSSYSPTGITLASAGGGGAHENLPPVTFVPYIVKLDD